MQTISRAVDEESITAQAGGDSGEFVPVDLIEEKSARIGQPSSVR